MSPSRTRCIGMEVHTETMDGAYGAHEPGAAVTSLAMMVLEG